MILTLGRKESI